MLRNHDVAELLAAAAEEQEPASQRQRALRRAARAALGWDVEAAVLRSVGAPLTDLARVGPWIASIIDGWLESDVVAPPVPPLRAGFLSRSVALETLRAAPQWDAVIRADLQMHTLSSDGHASLEAMARRCVELGYSHMAVTDHSEGLPIARGMNVATRTRQAAEVRALNQQLSAEGVAFTVVHGLEMNLSPDGEGDTDPAVLADLDLVLGAFHSKLRLTEDQTDRYLAALRNPTVDVLAHPRGRMFNHRLGLTARWDEVFEVAAERGVALEVDAYPDRQDLDVDLLRRAASFEDLWFAVDTDAHHPVDLEAMPLGLAALAIAGIAPERVLNVMAPEQLRDWVARRRSRATARAAPG